MELETHSDQDSSEVLSPTLFVDQSESDYHRKSLSMSLSATKSRKDYHGYWDLSFS